MTGQESKVRKQRRLEDILNRLEEAISYASIQTYPRSDHPDSSQRGTSFQVLIQIVVSQRATLENERLAAKRLFNRFKTPSELAAASVSEIAELIRPAGLQRMKAAAIKAIAREVLDRYKGNLDVLRELPLEQVRQELLRLPKVGPKTADCMLELGFGLPVLPVDANVHRVARRLGFAPKDAGTQTVQAAFEDLLPEDVEAYRRTHTFLLALGKYFCKAKPECEKCPVGDLCSVLGEEK